ncbi:hypothetical protein EMIHUDRAFT_445535 [Emiliania huxleyi CCMP1516]|uniref:CRAL-TRIO domain-containing protein n=2 Tax=Emiliania huxleyi TaxID=2903 RepID=A0A0D3I6R8_EMIH1|nr:hypothetical protein EMIHUDRAFT_438625 [Emiliania huxleyi CCMP1516]XP_005768241.1 hypothetical protein EMIHUDRAFT_445535 [Emiliania huxleyi CCMP1516]EOD06953.1 hypothetical protein EMIHUDRAFT_438625 [Emiliania huxleyi CCMP1516]EOD15812.1 hypothetical protein EMIHUDRAFT_445535 [Emiliania huxleyi CCMP1516]|eukprot:XP_005759382.1 hypothetical protein EMIHUDRAFT_438625 [Emiliania huxleyi CCMP1516]
MGAGGRSRLTFDETSAPPLQPQPRKAAQGNSDAGRRRYAWAGIFFLFAVAAPCARPSWELVSQLISLGGTGEQQASRGKVLLGPQSLAHGGRVVLERPEGLRHPILRISAGHRFDEDSVADAQAFMTRVLRQRRAFTVEWDPRGITWPRLSQGMMRRVHDWVEQHVKAWDTHVQAHVVLVRNPIARQLVRLLQRVFLPPQPTAIVRDEVEALAFVRSCCSGRPRSYVKSKQEYASRDARFALSSSS